MTKDLLSQHHKSQRRLKTGTFETTNKMEHSAATYHPVNIQKAIENGHLYPFIVDFPLKNGDFP